MPRLSEALGFTGHERLHVAPSSPHTSARRGPSFPMARWVGSVGAPRVSHHHPHPHPQLPGKAPALNSC